MGNPFLDNDLAGHVRFISDLVLLFVMLYHCPNIADRIGTLRAYDDPNKILHGITIEQHAI